MSLSPAVIDAMVAAGCTAEQLGAAMKASLAEQEARKEAKRANNAERQRRFKAKRREITLDNADNALPGVTPPPLPLSPQTPLTPTPTPGVTTRTRERGLERPEDVPEQVWIDFLALRKAKKAPVSETVIAGIRREAAKVEWTLEEALAATVAGGWQGFRARYVEEERKRGTGPPSNDSGGYLDHYLAKQARRSSG